MAPDAIWENAPSPPLETLPKGDSAKSGEKRGGLDEGRAGKSEGRAGKSEGQAGKSER